MIESIIALLTIVTIIFIGLMVIFADPVVVVAEIIVLLILFVFEPTTGFIVLCIVLVLHFIGHGIQKANRYDIDGQKSTGSGTKKKLIGKDGKRPSERNKDSEEINETIGKGAEDTSFQVVGYDTSDTHDSIDSQMICPYCGSSNTDGNHCYDCDEDF